MRLASWWRGRCTRFVMRLEPATLAVSTEGWGHIRFFGYGSYWFRSYSGTLLKSAKVSKTLLPHHSAPRLGSVCPHSGFGPWAAAMGHPWPSAANPASCRVTHAPKPAFGQRGLTGRLRSRSTADQGHSGLQAGLSVVLLKDVVYPLLRSSRRTCRTTPL